MDKFSSETQRRGKRACMVCSIVLPKTEFKRNGCPNCEEYLHLAGNEEAIELCTSSVYEGLIALADPTRSWVAKWQRIDKYIKGTYATKVMGTLPPDVVTNLLEEYNIRYIPRDGSAGNDDQVAFDGSDPMVELRGGAPESREAQRPLPTTQVEQLVEIAHIIDDDQTKNNPDIGVVPRQLGLRALVRNIT